MTDPVVCRRLNDAPAGTPASAATANCENCGEPVIVESGLEKIEPKLCIHCAVKSHPNTTIFVELPPDEFGHRSMAVGIRQVYAQDEGEWHKDGVWHNQRWVLARQE